MARNPALDTKVKALQAQLLTTEDYLALMSAEKLSEVIRYLKENTHYGNFLADIDPETASRVVIEAAFSKMILRNSKKLDYFILGAEKEFLKLITQRIDLENYLVILRALLKKEDLKQIVKHLTFSDKVSSSRLDNLIEDPTWENFKQLLKPTFYYRSVETYETIEPSELFQLEKTLERSYYDMFFKELKRIGNSDKNLTKLLRSEIDMLNLIWIYRAKKFYNLTVDEIIPFIYRGGLYVGEEDLYQLALIDNYPELLERLQQYGHYAFLFNHSEEDLDLHMDRRKKRFMFFEFKKLLVFGRAMSAAYSYLRLLEDETYDITSIIEGKRYDIPEDEMKKYLIRYVSE